MSTESTGFRKPSLTFLKTRSKKASESDMEGVTSTEPKTKALKRKKVTSDSEEVPAQPEEPVKLKRKKAKERAVEPAEQVPVPLPAPMEEEEAPVKIPRSTVRATSIKKRALNKWEWNATTIENALTKGDFGAVSAASLTIFGTLKGAKDLEAVIFPEGLTKSKFFEASTRPAAIALALMSGGELAKQAQEYINSNTLATLTPIITDKAYNLKLRALYTGGSPRDVMGNLMNQLSIVNSKYAKEPIAYVAFRPANVKFAAGLNQALDKYKVKPLQKVIPIPAMVPREAEVTIGDAVSRVSILGMDLSKHQKDRAYTPHYSVNSPDLEFMASMLHVAETAKGADRDEVMARYNGIVTFVNSHYSGNGSVLGQFGRFAKCRAVALAVRKDSAYIPVTATFKAYLTKHFPLMPLGIQLDTVELLTLANEYSTEGIVTYNQDADAGPLYQHLKRKETLMGELVLGSRILEVIRQMPHPEAVRALTANELAWARLTYLKNKEEVYLRTDYEEKTRNYFPTSAAAQFPASIAIQIAFREHALPWHVNDSHSLLGFSVFNGGMQEFMDYMRVPGRVCIYADNLYFSWRDKDGVVRYASVDGDKFESCLRGEDLQIFNSYLADCLRLDPVEGTTPSSAWRRYLEEFHSAVSCDQVAMIGPHQILNLGQGSGCAGTAQFNTAKMMKVMSYWPNPSLIEGPADDFGGRTWIIPEEGLQACRKAGVKLKVESVVTMDDTIYSGETIHVDCLGFDAVWLEPLYGIKRFAPVLKAEKFAAMVGFTKHSGRSKYVRGAFTVRETLTSIAKLQASFLLGGWLDPCVKVACAVRIGELVAQITDIRDAVNSLGTAEVANIFETVLSGMDADSQEMARVLSLDGANLYALPSIKRVLQILLGKDVAETYTANLPADLSSIIGTAPTQTTMSGEGETPHRFRRHTDIVNALMATNPKLTMPYELPYPEFKVTVKGEAEQPSQRAVKAAVAGYLLAGLDGPPSFFNHFDSWYKPYQASWDEAAAFWDAYQENLRAYSGEDPMNSGVLENYLQPETHVRERYNQVFAGPTAERKRGRAALEQATPRIISISDLEPQDQDNETLKKARVTDYEAEIS